MKKKIALLAILLGLTCVVPTFAQSMVFNYNCPGYGVLTIAYYNTYIVMANGGQVFTFYLTGTYGNNYIFKNASMGQVMIDNTFTYGSYVDLLGNYYFFNRN